MKILKIATPILLVLIAIFIWVAPVGPVPGFFIGGSDSPVPDSWGDTSDTHEIRLQVPGTLPRVVIIWCVQVDGELYIVGAKGSGWVSMLGQGGPVKMRMAAATYSLNAETVITGWETILNAYQGKYIADYPDIVNNFPPIEEARATTAVFRLSKG